MPGLIRYFDEEGQLSTVSYFPNGGDYKAAEPPGNFDPTSKQRGTNLGVNL